MIHIGSFINGKERKGDGRVQQEVRNPYNGTLVGVVDFSTIEDLEMAIQNAYDTFEHVMRKMPAHQRSTILRKSADLLEEQSEDFAQLLCQEAGKPIRDARGEVSRAIQVLRFASEEAKRNDGELMKMDAAIGGEERIGLVKRKPIGVIAAITPFNFPLNLVLHKLAPAVAAGCTVVLKPAEKTPLSAMKLVQLMTEAGVPSGAINVVNGLGADLVPPLVTHPYIKKVTFTGSGAVGFKIQEMARHKKITLELGANSPNIVFPDANLEIAVAGLVKGGFVFAGQACISVQRIYVHRDIYSSFVDAFVSAVQSLNAGDPALETTDVGPMITLEAACRAEAWIQEAVSQGARLLTGGQRQGTLLQPTVLTNVTPQMKVVCEEVFAPIVTILPFETEEEVIAAVNDSPYGLQAGVFTSDINRAFRLFEALEMGGVWINETSTVRHDHYPYGGVKQSGVGLEGVAYAIKEMTEPKFLGIRLV
ncbi:aldehyde dehydrogenase family protein [Anoxybacteroides amylolyticum]|uniref:3-sulfolactaldehyde dehydrogenase n=1 Tax=Anoxybacteroides amylolyticum TaxID=294699 RepID=A0A160F2R6_9BACL|nr:aldehyde dehydrogenase family protein [Anoxybacillus amylolyticus]ANB60538.1 aldehyde dehydrogenase family protein [Anoxybacillus amylolyticus]